jgi:hypothetical protein
MLLLVAAVSAEEFDLNVLQSGDTVYVWTDDMTPTECNTSCTIEIDIEECNSTDISEQVEDMLILVHDDLGSIKRDISDVSGSLDNVSCGLTAKQLNANLEALKSDQKIELERIVSNGLDGIDSIMSNLTNRHELELDLKEKEGDLKSLNSRLSGVQTQYEECSSENSNMNWVLVFAIGTIAVLLMSLLGAWPKFRREVGM